MIEATAKEAAETRLLEVVTCPNCWHRFPPEEILWIARHPGLGDDPMLVSGEMRLRFKPVRFNLIGSAIDQGGAECFDMACPHCHLRVPGSMLELPPLFLSVVGSPGSGKSWFLAAGLHQLQQEFGSFYIDVSDGDSASNAALARLQSALFENPRQDDLLLCNELVPKTRLDDASTALNFVRYRYGVDTYTAYPKPFIYRLAPRHDHEFYADFSNLAHAMCLYDHAGEHFQEDRADFEELTRHVAESSSLMFVIDPLQDAGFRKGIDPELLKGQEWFEGQHKTLGRVAERIRKVKRLSEKERHRQNVIVVLTKADIWGSLLDYRVNLRGKEWDWKLPPLVSRAARRDGRMTNLFWLQAVEDLSIAVEYLVKEKLKAVADTVERFAGKVTYIPVSALGSPGELMPGAGAGGRDGRGIRPRDIAPVGCWIPFAYAAALSTKGHAEDSARLLPIGRPDAAK